ncbi:hypothetical protein RJ639_027851 [Escallonia herrerae]|uniref:TPX2 central domain-containing protein n=1 Tax=Escallonia herrerae TaxID=1293975 RepID=A0AA89BFA2_9ASTE|nr:hypothetical protein RJ639_027851 [Escallonia herrerae]
MDEEMEDFVEDGFSPPELDSDYEFDAPGFFDFGRPESEAEVREAEGWFDSAKTYPPSPFIVKLNWSKGIPFVEAAVTPNLEDGENIDGISKKSEAGTYPPEVTLSEDSKGQKYPNRVGQDIPKAKAKSMAKSFKPRSATLMKPTASHLAKQNKARELKSSRLCRSQKPHTKVDERSLQSPPGFENQATKRQKLESGYLRKVMLHEIAMRSIAFIYNVRPSVDCLKKFSAFEDFEMDKSLYDEDRISDTPVVGGQVAHLKHQTMLLHKIAKKVATIDPNSTHFRAKVTIPKEPDLETAQRAQRQRSKNYGLGKHAKADVHTFKARPLNRKVGAYDLQTYLHLVLVGVVFHLKTTERAMQHSSANVVYATASLLQECKFLSDKKCFENPPTELFNKLSLKSESKKETKSQSKSQSKPHHCVKKCIGNTNQCGSDRRIPDAGRQHDINRLNVISLVSITFPLRISCQSFLYTYDVSKL